MTIRQAVDLAMCELSLIAQRARFESELLMAHVLRVERAWIHAHGDECLAEEKCFFSLVSRRKDGEPIEYITKRVSFFSKEFYIDFGALIPRPETELLVEKASALISQHAIKCVAEVGTGSGVIAIMLALLHPELEIHATDISPKALLIAKQNISQYGLENIHLYETSYLDGVMAPCELIVSNPPYIKLGTKLAESLDFEPQEALFGGENGEEILKEILSLAHQRKVRFVACEMGYDQKEAIQSHCLQQFPSSIVHYYSDLAGLDRGFVCEIVANIKPLSFAGQFYPQTCAEVTLMLDGFKAKMMRLPDVKPRAIIVPHAGYIYSGFTANTAYSLLAKNREISTIFILGSAHHYAFDGVSIADYEAYAGLAKDFIVDREAITALREQFGTPCIPAAHKEHSTETQLPFIRYHFGESVRVVEIVYGRTSCDEIEKLVDHILSKRHHALVMSSDLSHFYNQEQAQVLDQRCLDAITSQDSALLAGCEACGKLGIEALINRAPKFLLAPLPLDYRTSADCNGDKSCVVGYLSVAYIQKDSMQ